jgi:hypothetical protein
VKFEDIMEMDKVWEPWSSKTLLYAQCDALVGLSDFRTDDALLELTRMFYDLGVLGHCVERKYCRGCPFEGRGAKYCAGGYFKKWRKAHNKEERLEALNAVQEWGDANYK